MQLDGIKEKTNHNDGREVEMVLASCGLGKGYPYCAATINWTFSQCGIKTGVVNPAYSPNWFTNKEVITYKKSWRKMNYKSKKSQIFGLYFSSLGRIAHVGFIISETITDYITFEGNTNIAGSREGDGFMKKRRSKSSIHIIADYLTDIETKPDWRKNTSFE
jgi:hypothetical protein